MGERVKANFIHPKSPVSVGVVLGDLSVSDASNQSGDRVTNIVNFVLATIVKTSMVNADNLGQALGPVARRVLDKLRGRRQVRSACSSVATLCSPIAPPGLRGK